MTEEPLVPTVTELRQSMDDGLRSLIKALDRLDSSRLSEPTDEGGWSVRDHVAHLAVWADGMAALLRKGNRWAAMGLDITDADRERLGSDGVNDLVVDRHRDLTSAEAKAWLLEAHARVASAVESLTDEDLMRPYGNFASPSNDRGRPIFQYVVGNTFEHYDEHLPWIEAIAR
jgi:uncharacterized protein (TIGR03083 family)